MTPWRGIRAVTFDVGGTLIQPWPSVGQLYADVAARHGLKGLPVARLNENFAAAWRAKVDFHHSRREWAALVDQAFAGLSEQPPSQSFFPAIYQRFAEADAWRIYDDLLPTLDALASREIRLGIISNWDERLRPLLNQFELDRYFEIIVVSCEIGFAKPSPVIFEEAARRLGAPPQAILHVGDHRVEDVAGALDAGYRSLLLDRNSENSSSGQITSLYDLTLLIERFSGEPEDASGALPEKTRES